MLLALLSVSATHAGKRPEFKLPDNVEAQQVTIWSEGSRIDGTLWLPKNTGSNEKLPVIVMSHGFGGTKLKLQAEAAKFSSHGYMVLTFTYRGWGESEGKMVLLDGMPELDENNEGTARVRLIRRFLDSTDWIQDYLAAISDVEGHPQVDSKRIGAWGTSGGGAIVIWSTAHDERIAVTVTQVAALMTPTGGAKEFSKQRAMLAAREGLEPLMKDTIKGLEANGSINFSKQAQYDVVSQAIKIKVPTLLIDAENEQFINTYEGSRRVFDIIRSHGSTPVRYEVIPNIDHWGIYNEGFERGTNLALEWFDTHLKPIK